MTDETHYIGAPGEPQFENGWGNAEYPEDAEEALDPLRSETLDHLAGSEAIPASNRADRHARAGERIIRMIRATWSLPASMSIRASTFQTLRMPYTPKWAR